MTTHTRHTLDTLNALDDAAFNRVVADLAGGRVVEFHEDWDDHFGGVYGTRSIWYAYVAPGEERPRHKALRALTPWGAWHNAQYYGKDDAWAAIRIPNYANDLNAAWGLFGDDFDGEWHLVYETGNYKAWVFNVTYTARGDKAARVLSTAWYSWRKWHNQRED